MKSVLRYKDYREFLRSHADHRRRRNPRWTLGVWARRLGLGATTSLTMILNGQRNPGPVITEKLLRYFNFKAQERDYFLDLVELAKNKEQGTAGQRVRVLLTEDLKKLGSKRNPRRLDSDTFFKISKWYCYVIRQMTLLRGFRGDLDWMGERFFFPVSKKEIAQAVETLLEVGVLRRSKEGNLQRIHSFLRTQDDVASEGLKRFHEEMISRGREAIRLFDVQEREIGALTLAIRKDQMGEAKELIRQFLDDFEKLGGQADADEVCQLNVQLFPIARA